MKPSKNHYCDFYLRAAGKVKSSEKMTEEFFVRVYDKNQKELYCRPQDVQYHGWKVIVNNVSYYHSKHEPNRYNLVTNEIAVPDTALGFKVPSKEAGENVLSWVRSKLYCVVISNTKTSISNSKFIKMEYLGHDHHWTDEEIYAHFNLTDEEIALVEETYEKNDKF